MANRSQAEFMRQMLRLRARHQVRTPHELLEQAGPIEHHMSKQPKVYDERYCNISNSPLIQQSHLLLRELREMGLYIDEHRDFNEGMQANREALGKVAKPVRHKKKPALNEGITWSREDNWEPPQK